MTACPFGYFWRVPQKLRLNELRVLLLRSFWLATPKISQKYRAAFKFELNLKGKI